MMRNPSYFLLTVFALLALAACETSFSVELPEHEPVLVVNGLFRADSLWLVDLSHSVPLNGDLREVEIGNATVVIRSGGQVVDTLRKQYSNPGTKYEEFYGEYGSSSYHPQPGRTYTLQASAPGYETVTATSRVPEAVSFTMGARKVENKGYETIVEITVRFTDPGGEENRYLLLLQRRMVEPGDSTHVAFAYIRRQAFTSKDPVFLGDNNDCALKGSGAPRYGPFTTPAIFTDTDIDGETYEIEMRSGLRVKPRGDTLFEYYVVLVSLSEPYFRFKESLSCNFSDNDFLEPAQVYSNIEGGFGIFAGSNATRRRIEIK